MIVLELTFSDDPQRLAARPAHRAFLTELHASGQLVAAGPFADDSGALLVFNTDEEGLNVIMAQDPYFMTSGVTVTSVRSWQPIIGLTDSPK